MYSRETGPSTYTPIQFEKTYTSYYETENSDSPRESRIFLQEKIIDHVNHILLHNFSNNNYDKVKILSQGAGKQIFEYELEKNPGWRFIKDRVQLFTLDIASIHSKQLLSSSAVHTRGDGSHLHFRNNVFDMVYSNMAIDFMPRIAFSEVARVLKTDGVFIANLHHPNLIDIAKAKRSAIEHSLHTSRQNLVHGRGSSKMEKYKKRFEEARAEYETLEFVLSSFPQLIFHSTDEINSYFQESFEIDELNIEEHTENIGSNGWFYVEMRNMRSKKNHQFHLTNA